MLLETKLICFVWFPPMITVVDVPNFSGHALIV